MEASLSYWKILRGKGKKWPFSENSRTRWTWNIFQGLDGQSALGFLSFLQWLLLQLRLKLRIGNFVSIWHTTGLDEYYQISSDLGVQDCMVTPQGNNLYLNHFWQTGKLDVVKHHKGGTAKCKLFIKQFNLPRRQERVNQYDEGLLLSFVIENIKYLPWKTVD